MHKSCLLSYLQQFCTPHKLPEKWQPLQADRNAFRGPSNTDGILERLLTAHAEKELLKTGVAIASANGTIALNPLLAVPDVLVVAMVEPKFDAIHTLITAGGCLQTERWSPLIALEHDRTTRKLLKRAGEQLFLTSTLEGAVILRSAGLASWPGTGIQSASMADWDEILSLCAMQCLHSTEYDWGDDEADGGPTAEQNTDRPRASPGGSAPKGNTQPTSDNATDKNRRERKLEFFLVNWDPVEISGQSPQEIEEALAYFRAVEEHRRISMDPVANWQISQKSIAAVQFALGARQSVWCLDALANAAEDEAVAISDIPEMAVKPVDLATAAQQLFDVMNEGSRSPEATQRIVEARKTLRQVVRREIFGGIVRMAQDANPPLDKLVLFQTAKLAELATEKMQAVQEQLARKDPPSRGTSLDSSREVLQIYHEVLLHIQECKKCKPATKTRLKPQPQPLLFAAARLRNSDSKWKP